MTAIQLGHPMPGPGRRHRSVLSAMAMVALAFTLAAAPSLALPPGRAWTQTALLGLPPYQYVAAPLIDADENGIPWLVGNARNLTGPGDAAGFRWTGTSWALSWRLGRGTLFTQPVITTNGTDYLVWSEIAPYSVERTSLVMVQFLPGGTLVADTVTDVASGALTYWGAVTPSRRWVITDDRYGGRLLFSDTARVWHDIVAPIGSVDGGMAISTLDDATALVAWPTNQGMAWATARGYDWQMGGYVPNPDYFNSPALHRLPNGDQLLAWGSYSDALLMSTFRAGAWSIPESLRCSGLQGPSIAYTGATRLSSASSQPAAIGWVIYSFATGRDHLCICVANESGGFGQGEELTAAVDPRLFSIARDTNGDAWVAWWIYYEGIFWTHTYTTTTAGAPQITGAARKRLVSWTLSDPTPETWWAVLRSRGGGPFEVAARVRAGASAQMTWTDSTPLGALRYKIRRECVDTRYQWESGETSWPRLAVATPIVVRVKNPVTDGAEISLSGASAGPVDLQLYDLQGRLVWQHQSDASGVGEDTLQLDLHSAQPRLGPGVYFLRATDTRGSTSGPARIVILR